MPFVMEYAKVLLTVKGSFPSSDEYTGFSSGREVYRFVC
jgi:hypothetical protein